MNIPPVIHPKFQVTLWSQDAYAVGAKAGRKLGEELARTVLNAASGDIIPLSFHGISAVDGAFFEQVLLAATQADPGDVGVLLVDVERLDVERSCDLVAQALGLNIVLERGASYRFLGAKIKAVDAPMLDAVYGQGLTTARQVAARYSMSIANASTRLKRLSEKWLALRIERSAPSGGSEYHYHPIRSRQA